MEAVEPLGATSVVHVRSNRAADRTVRISVPGDRTLAVDDEAGIRIRRDRMSLFDERTGMAITAA